MALALLAVRRDLTFAGALDGADELSRFAASLPCSVVAELGLMTSWLFEAFPYSAEDTIRPCV